MPQLPSGRHVGISISPILNVIRKGDFALKMKFTMVLQDIEDMKHMTSIVYYRSIDAEGKPADAYLSGFNLNDIEQRKADWPDADYEAFAEWQKLPAFNTNIKESFTEIQQAVEQLKVKLPKSLHGLFD